MIIFDSREEDAKITFELSPRGLGLSIMTIFFFCIVLVSALDGYGLNYIFAVLSLLGFFNIFFEYKHIKTELKKHPEQNIETTGSWLSTMHPKTFIIHKIPQK